MHRTLQEFFNETLFIGKCHFVETGPFCRNVRSIKVAFSNQGWNCEREIPEYPVAQWLEPSNGMRETNIQVRPLNQAAQTFDSPVSTLTIKLLATVAQVPLSAFHEKICKV